ncbi:MarR family transcriptional regulator [Yinghuangia soli]|uniref:MarR family transcriptional regulator n=1 Tax=Yinghuangia soli TaxID=2908204 RepID=A0AA41Q7C3_9ACTN|nr:MarR family transcriptional regulator [Yinghuangia soli]MCF2532556.1 MarR family transcriptional regulator [Yinghuangia soli]
MTSTPATAAITLNPQVLGQAENAHRALLDKILRSHPGMAYQQWVGLALAAAAGGELPAEQLLARLRGALKTDAETGRAVLADLAAAGALHLSGSDAWVTEAGQEVFLAVRGEVETAMQRAYAGIPAADLATAGRVLAQVTAQLDAVLAEA